jgi:hypothetical protein
MHTKPMPRRTISHCCRNWMLEDRARERPLHEAIPKCQLSALLQAMHHPRQGLTPTTHTRSNLNLCPSQYFLAAQVQDLWKVQWRCQDTGSIRFHLQDRPKTHILGLQYRHNLNPGLIVMPILSDPRILILEDREVFQP